MFVVVTHQTVFGLYLFETALAALLYRLLYCTVL